MKGDFSSDTSKAALLAGYTRVLLQQGRPLLDADFNEQSAIHQDYLRKLVVDLMGLGWRPRAGQFSMVPGPAGVIQISPGGYYVDGIRCDNPAVCTFTEQPFLTQKNLPDGSFIAYIECWERHLSAVQRPVLREIALGGRDTASRAQIVWQVRAATDAWVDQQVKLVNAALDTRILPKAPDDPERAALTALKTKISTQTTALKSIIDSAASAKPQDIDAAFYAWIEALAVAPPQLRARAKQEAADNEACSIAPDAIYRGPENQLYRVEIHDPGTLADHPTFKWSRENGSVLFGLRAGEAIGAARGSKSMVLSVPLETLGHDRRTGICAGDWVELTSNVFELEERAPPLGQVTLIDRTRGIVTVEVTGPDVDFSTCTALRRWDQTEHLTPTGVVAVTEGSWIALERGVQIQFQPGCVYRTGDHWLIVARVDAGDVLSGPAFIEPDGIARHRAPIGQAIKMTPTGWLLSDAGRTHDLGPV
jgi:Family of unknown function (DUF6519)